MNQDVVVSIAVQAMEVGLKVALPMLLAEAGDELVDRHPMSCGIEAHRSVV